MIYGEKFQVSNPKLQINSKFKVHPAKRDNDFQEFVPLCGIEFIWNLVLVICGAKGAIKAH
jgi:hypothetical protein